MLSLTESQHYIRRSYTHSHEQFVVALEHVADAHPLCEKGLKRRRDVLSLVYWITSITFNSNNNKRLHEALDAVCERKMSELVLLLAYSFPLK